ncbi:MAG: formylglycine-generating enzyme family protein [Thermoguttaceae bacterium]
MRTFVIWSAVLLALAGTAFSEDSKQPPKELTVDLGGGVKMELVLIPAGEFMMGSPDSDDGAFAWEQPQHRVRITKPFYLGKYPVTQGQYERVMGKNPSWFCKSGAGKDKIGETETSQFPVEQVLWEEAMGFCKRLSEKEKKKYRLPTEAQWEYACRAGSTTRYCFGDDETQLGDYAWFGGTAGLQTHPVGQKKRNAWGLYDIHGNVWEWCQDWYERYQANSPTDDPTGPTTSSYRVFRGGSWFDDARYCRSACRKSDMPEARRRDLGFRVVAVLMVMGCDGQEKGGTVGEQHDDSIAKATTEDSPRKESDAREKATTVAEKTIATKLVGKEHPSNRDLTGQVHPTAADERSITNSIGMKLILIPAGEFLMGSPDSDKDANKDEQPQHRVRITRPFYLGKYLVTQWEYERVMGKNPSFFCKSGDGNDQIGEEDTSQFPVEQVSWEDAIEFCKRLSEKEKKEYRLPTEAQWEYACRAGSTTRWFCGDDEKPLGEYAWYTTRSYFGDDDLGHGWSISTHPVGQKKPNVRGLCDMHGNVFEWCQDWYDEHYYQNSPADNPIGPATGSDRVHRGGGWFGQARSCRSAYRFASLPGSRTYDVGFRVLLVAANK